MMRWEHAQAVGLDLQRSIESRAHIFHRDQRGQIDNLLGIEIALQLFEHVVGDIDG
ncbi:MAG: hypothetical protein JWM69_682 [Candidatus Binatus sp.]|nr:hypothetical protein [Candidatus Binatus sp.]